MVRKVMTLVLIGSSLAIAACNTVRGAAADVNSAANGGEVGSLPLAQVLPEAREVLAKMKPGQVSDIVTTQFGYHIIKVIDHKPGRTVPYEEAQGRIKEFLTGQKKQEHADAFIDGLKKKSKIEVLI